MEINPREKQGSAMAVWGMGVMVGPILGPTLGGWLTDSYNWRWVFFINVPIGAARRSTACGDTSARCRAAGAMRFDVFGFATLSLAIGALQLLLDRGQQNDWFSSTETWIEAIVAGRDGHLFHRAYADDAGGQVLRRLSACSRIRISSPACCSSSSWAWCCMRRVP